MTTFTYQNKEYEVIFDWNYINHRNTFTCFLFGPTSAVADVAIQNPIDTSNSKKGQKIALERAARRLASHLWKKGGPRPHHIKNAILSCYNDAVLKENNPELWEQVQVKKAEQKKITDAKRQALKEENARIKEAKRLERENERKKWEERRREYAKLPLAFDDDPLLEEDDDDL